MSTTGVPKLAASMMPLELFPTNTAVWRRPAVGPPAPAISVQLPLAGAGGIEVAGGELHPTVPQPEESSRKSPRWAMRPTRSEARDPRSDSRGEGRQGADANPGRPDAQ